MFRSWWLCFSADVPVDRDVGVEPARDVVLDLARRDAATIGATNVEFVKGYIEDSRLPAASGDVVISNCVLNLSIDKPTVIREAARGLRPGGRFAISDVIVDENIGDATRADMQSWTGCIARSRNARHRDDRDAPRPRARRRRHPRRSQAGVVDLPLGAARQPESAVGDVMDRLVDELGDVVVVESVAGSTPVTLHRDEAEMPQNPELVGDG